jgi:rubredoxin
MTHPPEDSPIEPIAAADSGAIEATSSEPAAPAPPDRYECRSCGYVYEPAKGDERRNVAPNTPFETLPENWRCPVCGVKKYQFKSIGPAGKASGFDENLGYGIGVNTLTPGAKNVLIFSVLGLGILLLLSFYGLN